MRHRFRARSRLRAGGGTGGITPPAADYRVATVQNRPNFDLFTMTGADGMVTRFRRRLGQDMESIVFVDSNRYQTTVFDLPNTNAMTIVSRSIETLGGLVIPVTWGGSRSRTFSTSDYGIESDEVPKALFDSGILTRGTDFWVRTEYRVPNLGDKLPYTVEQRGDVTNQQIGIFNTANTTPSSVDATGLFTATGTAFTTTTSCYQPMIVGESTNDSPSFIVCGDSIDERRDDTASGSVFGRGYIQRSMRDASSNDPLPCINFAVGGSLTYGYTSSPYFTAHIKYCRFAIDKLGTNDLNSPPAISVIQARMEAVWAHLTANGIEGIIRDELLINTTSSNNYIDAAGQTYATEWEPGGMRDLLMNWMSTTKVLDGTLLQVVTYPGIRDALEPNKWKTDGVTPFLYNNDNVHPKNLGHETMAIVQRPILRALT